MTAARDRLLSGEQALTVGVVEGGQGAGIGEWELPLSLMMNDCVLSLDLLPSINSICFVALCCAAFWPSWRMRVIWVLLALRIRPIGIVVVLSSLKFFEPNARYL